MYTHHKWATICFDDKEKRKWKKKQILVQSSQRKKKDWEYSNKIYDNKIKIWIKIDKIRIPYSVKFVENLVTLSSNVGT